MPDFPPTRPIPSQLRLAEVYMRDKLAASIYVAEIAAAAGCAERTIIRIFFEYRDAHPLQVLSKLRTAQS